MTKINLNVIFKTTDKITFHEIGETVQQIKTAAEFQDAASRTAERMLRNLQ